jgi:hypothetical protein
MKVFGARCLLVISISAHLEVCHPSDGMSVEDATDSPFKSSQDKAQTYVQAAALLIRRSIPIPVA